jgi:hypothetical protein
MPSQEEQLNLMRQGDEDMTPRTLEDVNLKIDMNRPQFAMVMIFLYVSLGCFIALMSHLDPRHRKKIPELEKKMADLNLKNEDTENKWTKLGEKTWDTDIKLLEMATTIEIKAQRQFIELETKFRLLVDKAHTQTMKLETKFCLLLEAKEAKMCDLVQQVLKMEREVPKLMQRMESELLGQMQINDTNMMKHVQEMDIKVNS